MRKMQGRKADIWISTVIYMLIGLAIISALLIAAKPKIEEARDRFTINYMINAFNSLDSLINEVNEVPGSGRIFEIKVSKGELKFIPKDDRIEWQIATKFKFSEPSNEIKVGNINVLTLEQSGKITTTIFLNYTQPINITTLEDDEGTNLTLTQSPVPYKVQIKNLGAPQGSINNTIYVSV